MFCDLYFNLMVDTAIGKSAGIKLKLELITGICPRQDDGWKMDAYIAELTDVNQSLVAAGSIYHSQYGLGLAFEMVPDGLLRRNPTTQ